MINEILFNVFAQHEVKQTEKIQSYYFYRELDRECQIYKFYLVFMLEENTTRLVYPRLIFLGSTPRNISKFPS